MKIIDSLQNYSSNKKTVLTIGSFDGVHIGHKKIIQKIISSSKLLDCESLVLTFFPHPKIFLNQNSDIKLLNTIDEKIDLFEKTGLQNLIIQPFDKNFSDLSAKEFIEEILVKKLHVAKIIIGYDHRFGKNRLANVDDLIASGSKYNFEVEQITAQEIDAVAVSSTKIRTAILEGNITLANEYLGYNYILTGVVVTGKQLGRTIGYPTANIRIGENYKLIPKIGVYIVSSFINNQLIFGMMNIGYNPTVGGQNLSTEVHFFNLDENLYDKKLTIAILSRIRDEHKFESIAVLKNQLAKDKEFCISFIEKHLM